MSGMIIFATVVAVALFVYLAAVLIRPEVFS